MNNQATQEKLTQMRLWGMQRAFRGVLEGGIGAKYTADELIGHLVDAEWDERHNRRLARLLKGARFRYQATFEQIDFRRARNLDKNLVLRLSDANWVQEHRNVIVTGPTGVGKSFLCSAIGHQACLHGFKTRYFNCTKFFPQTRLWVADGSYLKQIDQIARTDVVIFDDLASGILMARPGSPCWRCWKIVSDAVPPCSLPNCPWIAGSRSSAMLPSPMPSAIA